MAKLTNNNNKTIVEIMANICAEPNMECGKDEIEFPDGTKLSFYYNGEADRQAAIKFAQLCYDGTNSTDKAMAMMAHCYSLMLKKIVPTEIVTLSDGYDYYIDHSKKILCTSNGTIISELTGAECISEDRLLISRLLIERAERVIND